VLSPPLPYSGMTTEIDYAPFAVAVFDMIVEDIAPETTVPAWMPVPSIGMPARPAVFATTVIVLLRLVIAP
jgi:hypothetical protein